MAGRFFRRGAADHGASRVRGARLGRVIRCHPFARIALPGRVVTFASEYQPTDALSASGLSEAFGFVRCDPVGSRGPGRRAGRINTGPSVGHALAPTRRWISAPTIAGCWSRGRPPTAFRVVDAFSRIVRLGEGLSQTGRLSEAAIERTMEALRVCRDKMRPRGVTRARLIATEACRSAANGPRFLDRVRERLGLQLEVVDRETEAYLAAAGCGELADASAEATVLFDIGGGSSEIVWMARGARRRASRRGLGVAAARRRLARRDVRRRRRDAGNLRRDDGARRRRARRLRRARGRRAALRTLPPARHLGHGDDARRRASRPAALRPPRHRRPVADARRDRRGGRRACAP